MEVVGLIASIAGIISFIVSCIELYKRIRSKYRNIPEIISRIIRELKAAQLLMRRASQVMQQSFEYDAILDVNLALTACERYVRKLSLTAERVEDYRDHHKTFPEHTIPELEKQREELGDGVLKLTSDLRLLECRKTGSPTTKKLEPGLRRRQEQWTRRTNNWFPSLLPLGSLISSRMSSTDNYASPPPVPYSEPTADNLISRYTYPDHDSNGTPPPSSWPTAASRMSSSRYIDSDDDPSGRSAAVRWTGYIDFDDDSNGPPLFPSGPSVASGVPSSGFNYPPPQLASKIPSSGYSGPPPPTSGPSGFSGMFGSGGDHPPQQLASKTPSFSDSGPPLFPSGPSGFGEMFGCDHPPLQLASKTLSSSDSGLPLFQYEPSGSGRMFRF